MSTLIPQGLVDAQNTGIQQLFAFSSTAFDGIEKLTQLNLQVVKATLAENQALMAKALSAKPEELISVAGMTFSAVIVRRSPESRHPGRRPGVPR